MIEFKLDGPDLKKMEISGSIDTILSEISVEISLIYGALNKQNKDVGHAFKDCLVYAFRDESENGICNQIFSDDVYDAYAAGGCFKGSMAIIDEKNLFKIFGMEQGEDIL